MPRQRRDGGRREAAFDLRQERLRDARSTCRVVEGAFKAMPQRAYLAAQHQSGILFFECRDHIRTKSPRQNLFDISKSCLIAFRSSANRSLAPATRLPLFLETTLYVARTLPSNRQLHEINRK